MPLQEKLVSSFMVMENRGKVDLDSSIHDIRTKAMASFEKEGFPTRKDEEWKYTSLKSVLNHDYSVFPEGERAIEFKDVQRYFLHEIESYKVVFIDGVYSSFLSETTHDGFDICLMSAALKKPKYKLVLDNYFNKIAQNKNSLADLNTAFTLEGAYIHIGKNKILPKPVEIVNFYTGGDKDILLQPRNLVVADENSYVQIIERHQNLSSDIALTNSVTEIFAGKRAIVDYYKIQNDTETSSLIDSTFVQQKENSVVSVNTFSFGGKLIRNNVEFFLEGEHIESHINGISVLNKKQHVDNHTLIHHKTPNCESFELYKGIYDDASIGVFNGKVIVDQEAQKTNAFQQNNNILIGDKATINAKPQLEIFADDVKCSHGCTIGQLDQSALFYMQSRGIPTKEAKALLLYAFGNEVVEKIKIPELKTLITKLIANKLGVKLGFEM
jgi:Fe-S cluster assembly protein SufD